MHGDLAQQVIRPDVAGWSFVPVILAGRERFAPPRDRATLERTGLAHADCFVENCVWRFHRTFRLDWFSGSKVAKLTGGDPLTSIHLHNSLLHQLTARNFVVMQLRYRECRCDGIA